MDQRHFQRDAWAAAWARRSLIIDHLTPLVMERLAPVPGERIVDVGTGLAPVALAAAAAAGPDGYVVGVDVSPQVLALAAARADAKGLSNVRFECLDASSAIIPGAPFDAATSLLGVMFFPDPVAAFANIRRHVLPGGRLVAGVWASPEENRLQPEVLLRRYGDPAICDAPFSLVEPETAERVLREAGWRDVSVERLALTVDVRREAVFDKALFELYGVPRRRAAEASTHVEGVLLEHTVAGLVRVPLALKVIRATNRTFA